MKLLYQKCIFKRQWDTCIKRSGILRQGIGTDGGHGCRDCAAQAERFHAAVLWEEADYPAG